MKSEEYVKKVYVSKSVGPHNRGRPHARWKGRVKSTCVRGATTRQGLDQAKKECLDRER